MPVFGVSLATMVLTSFCDFVLTNGLEIIDGMGGLAVSAVIFMIAAALLVYARRLARTGVLRWRPR